MRVALGTFACAGLKTHLGSDMPAGVQTALSHYARALESGLPPVGIPRFRRGEASQGTEVAFELTVDAQAQMALEQEAERQGTTPEGLAAHAVLLYLADLDRLGAVLSPHDWHD